MSRTACNNRGITLVEVLITLFLTTVGILALLSMQPTSWNAAGRSDFMGRAAGILQSELERNELWLMNPDNTSFATSCDTVNHKDLALGECTWTINASNQLAASPGDVPFKIRTTIAPFGTTTNAWTVTVVVLWANDTRSIRETMIVSRQEYFKQS